MAFQRKNLKLKLLFIIILFTCTCPVLKLVGHFWSVNPVRLYQGPALAPGPFSHFSKSSPNPVD